MEFRVQILRYILPLLTRSVNSRDIERVILRLASKFGLNILDVAHRSMGVQPGYDFSLSGERYLINEVLRKHICHSRPVLFDVGANTGEYSKELRQAFRDGDIYAFEPNSHTYEIAEKYLVPLGVHCQNVGFGERKKTSRMYTYESDRTSGHASIYKNVFDELYESTDLAEIEFEMTTVDEFCDENDIGFIDFLKIDTEGHEKEVLAGASRMISEKRISIIQFEFNTMHVYSRVFLRDFYNLLKDYRFYRLDTHRLIPIFTYTTFNEIFRFQNILATIKEIQPVSAGINGHDAV